MSSLKICLCSVMVALFVACEATQKPQSEVVQLGFTGHWLLQAAHDSVQKYSSVKASPVPPMELAFQEGIDTMFYTNPTELVLYPIRKGGDNQLLVDGFIDNSTGVITLGPDGHLYFTNDAGQLKFFRVSDTLAKPMFKHWKSALRTFYQKQL